MGSETCQNYVSSECNKIQTSEAYLETVRQSCIATNRVDTHYHMNWSVLVKAGYHTTTMEDCCRPTCAWPTNVQNTRDGRSRSCACDGTGTVD